MVTFKLSKVEIIQQSNGFSSSIKVQVSNIASDECSSIPWDEFQVRMSFPKYVEYFFFKEIFN